MSDTAELAELAETAPAGAAAAAPAERPAHVPEKFWDAEGGMVRLEALLKSYLELERKLGTARPNPEPEAAPAGTPADGHAPSHTEPPPAPAAPQGYTIRSPHPLVEPPTRPSTPSCSRPAFRRRRRSSSTTSPPSGCSR
jgi:hypothetical protein